MKCEVEKESQIWRFEIDRPNTGEMHITDPLLDSEPRAEQRAMSEFLKNAYIAKAIQFNTYRTDLTLNEIINVAGLPYLIKSLSFVINDDSIITSISAVRYE